MSLSTPWPEHPLRREARVECVLARLEVQPDVARVPHVVRGSALAAKLEVVHLEAVVADGLVRKVVWK